MIETKQLQIFKTIVDVGSFTGAGEAARPQSVGDQSAHARARGRARRAAADAARAQHAHDAGGRGVPALRAQVLEQASTRPGAFSTSTGGSRRCRAHRHAGAALQLSAARVLVELKQRFPRIDARVSSGHTAATLARLVGGELDVALLPLPVEAERSASIEVGRDELVAVVPPDHAWASLPFVTRARLRARVAADLRPREPDHGSDARVSPRGGRLPAHRGRGRPPRGVEGSGAAPARRRGRSGVGGARELAAGRWSPCGSVRRVWTRVGRAACGPTADPATLRALVRLFAEALPPLFARAA